MKRRWIIVTLVGAALLVGTAFGPAVVQAATAGLVRVEGGGSTHVATVNTAGQLSVTDGTQHSQAGQLKVVTSDPGKDVTKLFKLTCAAGGSYTVPPGKALIITGLVFYNIPTDPANPIAQDVFIGPAATPCITQLVAAGISPAASTTIPQTFDPGIAVPAGDAVGGEVLGNDPNSAVGMYGYLVPAADVPAGTVSREPHGALRGLGIAHH